MENNKNRLVNTPIGMYAITPNAEDSDYYDFSEIEKDIIKPGVIFCLKQRNAFEAGEKVNPVSPFFLIYIRQDGTVRYNYVNIKQILDIYRSLCRGITEPKPKLYELFNTETDNGEDMSIYATLIQTAIKEIISVNTKRSASRLTFDRNAVIAPVENQIHNEDSFELITWLVIK